MCIFMTNDTTESKLIWSKLFNSFQTYKWIYEMNLKILAVEKIRKLLEYAKKTL